MGFNAFRENSRSRFPGSNPLARKIKLLKIEGFGRCRMIDAQIQTASEKAKKRFSDPSRVRPVEVTIYRKQRIILKII
jgi:hypothetical protein